MRRRYEGCRNVWSVELQASDEHERRGRMRDDVAVCSRDCNRALASALEVEDGPGQRQIRDAGAAALDVAAR